MIKMKLFDDTHSIYTLFILIQSCNNKSNFLNVYIDSKYIHIEFRGLATVHKFLNIDSFKSYISAIKDLYQLAVDISNREINAM